MWLLIGVLEIVWLCDGGLDHDGDDGLGEMAHVIKWF